MTQVELAAFLGTSKSTLNRHINHGRVLAPKLVIRIFFVTLGAVRPDDFYDLNTMPREIEELMKGPKAKELRRIHKSLSSAKEDA